MGQDGSTESMLASSCWHGTSGGGAAGVCVLVIAFAGQLRHALVAQLQQYVQPVHMTKLALMLGGLVQGKGMRSLHISCR